MIQQWSHKLPLNYLHVVLIIITAFCYQSASAQNSFFRYTNDQGVRVITDSISPNDAIKGYEIIDSKGNVIKVVPAELSPEEKTKLDQEKERKRQQEKYDKELLSRYSTVEDIESTKQRRLQEIENSIRSLYLTLDNISETIKNYQAEAASNERQGETVSENTLASIKKLQKDRAFIEQEIVNKENRKKNVAFDYEQDIERLKVLKSK